MKANTNLFGEIDIPDEKIITFEQGIMGFEDCKKFTIIYDSGKEERSSISWLQCMDNPELAFSMISPFYVMEDYNPIVESEWLKPLGEVNDDNVVIFVLMNIKSDITKLTANMKAPIIINSDTCKGAQLIVENQDYEIKYNIYDVVHNLKKAKGDC
ncbi:MAG: flagellar assembly protein FliW [Lachnospiraceae bacterium]|nr:flagellar assembly protein FliW [Lachnospiraceae bacterium]